MLWGDGVTLSMQRMSNGFDIQDLLAGHCYAVHTRDFDVLDSSFTTDACPHRGRLLQFPAL